jgi:LysM repeat protein
MVNKKRVSFAFVLILLVAFFVPQKTVTAANTISADEIISSVNGMRASNGLPAMIVSSALTSCAQWTAETMASIEATGHLSYLGYPSPKSRCAGFGFSSNSMTENWAMGYSLSLNKLMYDYWADSAHMLPMTQSQYSYIGIGISEDASGGTYYVLEAGGSGSGSSSSGSSTGTTGTSGTTTGTNTTDYSQYIIPVKVATPDATGLVSHKVQYGQALITIALAYGVTVNELKSLNKLTSADLIYDGQDLKIKQVATPTPAPTVLATETPQDTPSVLTDASPTAISLIVRTPTAQPSTVQVTPTFDRQTAGLLMVIFSFLGLAAVAFFVFRKPPQG